MATPQDSGRLAVLRQKLPQEALPFGMVEDGTDATWGSGDGRVSRTGQSWHCVHPGTVQDEDERGRTTNHCLNLDSAEVQCTTRILNTRWMQV